MIHQVIRARAWQPARIAFWAVPRAPDSWPNIHGSGSFVMPEIISLAERKRERTVHNPHIIEKIVDGEVIKCVNIDTPPPQLLSHFLATEEEETPRS